MNNWIVFVVLYLIATTIYTQMFKVSTKNMKKEEALIILLQAFAGFTAFLFTPFMELNFTSDIHIYITIILVTILYTITDRLNTKVMSGVESSTFNILQQLSTAFMIFAGLIFLKEKFVLLKFLGAIIIIFSNILVFFKKGKFEFNKYVLLGIISNVIYTVALFLNVDTSKAFNMPLYSAITLLVPAIILMIVEKVKFSDLKEEFSKENRKNIALTGISWAIMILTQLRAYQLQSLSIVAPILALTVMMNVIFGYVFLKEREDLSKKIIAAIFVVLGIVLIRI